MDKKQRKTLSEKINRNKGKIATIFICIAIGVFFLLLGSPGNQSADFDGEDAINESRAERIEEQAESSSNKKSGSLLDQFLSGTEKAKENLNRRTGLSSESDVDTETESTSSDSTSSEKYQLIDTESYTVKANDGGFSESELDEGRTSFLKIPELDVLGRASSVYKGSFQKSDLKNDGRPDISHIHPSGWQQAYYNTSITGSDHEALYDRGHIIAEFLSDYSEENNFVTLTRQANLAMAQWENEIGDFLDNNPGIHVLYKVTPNFIGTDFVCSGLTLQAQSVEDNGAGLGFTVYIKNVEHGITINYSNGESSSGEVTVTSGKIFTFLQDGRRYVA